MRKIYCFYPFTRVILIALFSFIINLSANAQCNPGSLAGSVFVDANFNGVRDEGETGQAGIMVRVYNAAGTVVAQAVTNGDGNYNVPGLVDKTDYLVDFELDAQFQLSAAGNDNGTDIQLVSTPVCDVNLGVHDAETNCSDNTELILSCFVNAIGSSNPGQETLVGIKQNFNATATVNVYATQAETGSVWGMAYNTDRKEIYSAAFVKQNSELTSHGHDAIFVTRLNPTQTELFTTLSDLGQNVGSLLVSDVQNCNYGKQVGKIGIGALAIDENNEYLYATNLYNNSIVKINTTERNAATTSTFMVPNPGCSFNDFSVFALKYYEGRLYVGVTCTAETSQEESDTYMHVYSMNPTSGNFTLELSSDYTRGPWTDSNSDKSVVSQWLTDIDFSDEGNMLLALSDRKGHNYCKGTSSRVDNQFGDLLIAARQNGNWVLESNGTAGSLTGTGVSNGQGPGGGEFFGEDFFPLDKNVHPEVCLGSISVTPGTGQVVSSVYDPLFNSYSGGLHRYSTDNGKRTSEKELYNSNIETYFGKATGFGDIISICGPVDSEIGNLVWVDENCDGLQNAGEPGIAGLRMHLFDEDCNLIGLTSTDANGKYTFNSSNVDSDGDGHMDGIEEGKSYLLSIDSDFYDPINQSFTINGQFYFPTDNVAGDKTNSDLSDNQQSCIISMMQSIPTVEVTATSANNSNYDLGLKPATDFDLALSKTIVSNTDLKIGETVTFEIKVVNQGGVPTSSFEIVDYITPAFSFTPSENPGWVMIDGMLRKTVNMVLNPSLHHVERLKLVYVGSNDREDDINYAEIAAATDNFGYSGDDIDSQYDLLKSNDKGGVPDSDTDDLLSDDGTLDEDDHDPAHVRVLDLALKNVVRDIREYDVGDDAVFDMTVYNQGNVAVSSFEVTNFFPTSLSFNASKNTGWVPSIPGFVKYNSEELLYPGESRTISLVLTLVSNGEFEDIIDMAEISAMVPALPIVTVDVDSDPDDFMFNDNGGNPYDYTDNLITDRGSNDEDDHDPAVLNVRKVDYALMKDVTKQVFNIGDEVEFIITVYNQGGVAAGSMTVVDYIPEGMSLLDSRWTLNGANQATRTIEFENGLAPGEEYAETIRLKIEDNAPKGKYIVNYAEIAYVTDMFGVDISSKDVDSAADMVSDNDMGGELGTFTDNNISDSGLMDEDDQDPAGFFIAEVLTGESACQCLNMATEPYNGLFSQEIVIHSVSGEDWFIDAVNQIYEDTSTPGALNAFTTGDAGYQLGKSDQGDGTTHYIFSGVFEDGKNFTIRLTNGNGAYIQFSDGGAACSYDRPVISSQNGLSAVCTGSLHTYYASNIGECTDYEWTLSGGGTPMGSTTEDEITILWDNSVGGPYELRFETTCNDDCMAPVVEEIRVGTGGVSMSCLEQVNVSLNFDCSSYVSPEVFIQSDIPYGVEYRLMLIDQNGNVVPNNYLTEDYLWQDLTAKVIDPCTGNLCWSTLTVEDKMAPYIQCGPITVPCYLLNNYEPIVLDNCAEATYQMTSEEVVFRNCDPDIIKDVYRTFVATDSYGNVSEPCTQQISLERLKFDDIVFPEDLLQSDDTNLTCIDSIYDDEGNIRLDLTGIPTVNGIPVYPIQDLYCNVAIEFEDVMLSGQGCLRKIMRRWTYYEDRCSYSEPQVYVQTIEVFDDEDPVAVCPADVTINSSGGVECEGDWDLILPEVTDNCADEFLFKISYPGFFDDDAEEGMTLTFPTGTTKLNYTVYDGCDNFSLCDVNITVLDETPPTAVCDKNTVVSLRSNGTAKSFASTFDDGSTDDCSLLKMLIKREDSNCECNIPVFEDMFYMGAYNGKFYYLSKFKTHGTKAFLYSDAYGGELVKLETEAEADWVHEQSKSFISNSYYIGLTDADHQGSFTWADHTEPGFDNWYYGHPIDIGDHVITNADGEWLVVDGNDVETYYVMEVDNQCGYSDEVNFCCADVVEEQTVVLRVIDYFGRYNECTLQVEIQDKVEPDITCPPAREVDCDQILDFADLSEFGDAQASDQCNVTLSEEVIDQRDNCGFGTVIRRFRASDDNGYSECDQILTFSQTNQFDPSTIIWPGDFDSDEGCDTGGLHPDIIGRPIYQQTGCSMVVDTFYDATFDFSENDETDACLKILRTWEVIDWCQTDDPDYEPAIYQQTIKVTDLEAPEILGTCEPIVIETFNCDTTTVNFSELAMDSCTDDLDTRLQIDIYSDGMGVFDMDITGSGNEIIYNSTLPIGEHFALLSFTDECNNTTTCTKQISIRTIQGPTAKCIEGLNVALEPMDLNSDGFLDTEMACITPSMINGDTLGSFHPCGFDFNLSFSADLTDTIMCFDCDNLETMNEVELWVTDEFGNTSVCSVFVDVQDNNNVDFCPRFDLALTKTLDSNGPFMQGSEVVFDLTVYNQGNMDAYNIELVDYVPFGLTLTDSAWEMMQGNEMATLVEPIEFIAAGDSTVVQIAFEVSSNFMEFELTNCAEISAADDIDGPAIDADSDMDDFNNDQIGLDNALNNENSDEDDHDCETIEVEQVFDISLTKECADGSTGPFAPGDQVTFVFTVTNNGTLDANNVMIVDYIPEGLSLTDATWTDNGGITATLDSPIAVVPAGGSADVNIVFTIDADFMGDEIINTAEIIDPNNTFPLENESGTPGNNDPNEDDWDSKEIAVEQTFDLALQKVLVSGNTPDLGDDVTFEITVYNQGTLDATNIDIMDYIPDGFTFIPAKNSDFVDAAPNAQATIPFLASCDSETLEIVLTLDDQALPAPTLINNAEIIDADNDLGQDDQDSPLADVNAVGADGTPNELGSDNDISDEGCGGTGTGVDNPNDEDDFDGATVDVNCPPEAICLQGFQLILDVDGLGTLNAQDLDQGSNDDCSQTLVFTVNQEFYTCDDLGDNAVTLTVTANPSGLSDDCMTTITVVDNTGPEADCEDITVGLDGNGEATITPEDIGDESTDQCNMIDLELDNTDFDCGDIGDNVVVLTVTDSGNNVDTCDATVTVIDQVNPTVECVTGPVIIDLGDDGIENVAAALFVASSDDNCGIASTIASQTSFDCDNVAMGTILVSITVTDASGNSAMCMTTVDVQDNDDPECTVGFNGVDIVANLPITTDDFDQFTATDNCTSSANIDVSINPAMFDCADVGNQELVTVTVTDAFGNSSTCSVTVDVIDDTAPVALCQDITVSLDANGEYSLAASEVDGGSSAGCINDPTLDVDIDFFDCSDLGDNVVVLTVSANAQMATCNATVTVIDDEDPTVTCEPDFTVSLPGGMAMISTMDIIMSSDDNCSIASSSIDMSVFDCDDDGQTFTVTATVTDPSGNTDTCTTDVTVDDDEAPSCTLLPDLTFAPNMNITLADIVTNVDTYFSDNCADAAASVTGVPTSFDCTMLGTNTITVTVTDNSGNSASCTTDVSIEDIPAPVCLAQDITISLDNEGNYDLDPSEVDDGSFAGCAIPLTFSVDPMFLGCNDVSLSPIDVVLTVTDNNGVSTTCVAEVTVLDDIDPVISCESALKFDLDANGEVNLDVTDIVLTADDGCGIDTQVLDISMFDCSNKDTDNTVIATVTDTNGNSTTCEADITVEDNTAPTCTLLVGLTFPPEVVITPADVLDSFDDNCATASSMSSLSPNEFTCNELGDQVVTLTVEDDCGNSSTCEGTIEIVDSSVPMAVCADITVSLDSDGNYTLTGAEVDGGSSAACGEDLEFSVDPSAFTCDSIGANIVVLTVTASGGGTDTCEATVTVQDTLAPVIVCPPQVFFPCETDINDLTVFGSPSATDNCTDPVTIVESDSIDVNTCNVGTIIRTFTATDDSGNSATCSQIVIIEGPSNPLVEADITWPTSPFDPGNCIPDPDAIDSGMPIVDTAGLDCFNITITSSDNVIGNPQCDGTIERTWVVTDSCQAPGGVFTFTQIINILDDEGPDISGPNDITIILPPGNTTCDTFINLAATVTDCTTGFTAVNDSPFADDNNIADASGTYPVGETDVTITATDICGNTSTYAYTVNVVDTTAFLLDCAKVIDNIESNQQVVVHIDQTQFEVDFGDCMGGAYTVSWSNTVPNQDTVIATCADVGIADYTIYLWSGGIVIDSCTNLFQIVDGGGFCNSAITDGTITGTLTMEDQRLIDGVNVDLDGSPFETLITNGDGNYAFPSMEFGGTYSVVPEKDYDYLNGVSTLDLIAIQKHILGTSRIDSPYKLIAADINRSGNITGSDLLELRKLILGVYDELPNNTSWRFIDKSHKFIDPLNPFAYDIPEIYDILTFDQSMIIDFIGVKVGDINNTAIANAAENRIDRRSAYKFNYQLAENAYEAGQTIEIPFSSDQLDQLIGIQHSLVVNPDLAEIMDVIPVAASVDVSNIRIADKSNGVINFSWNGDYDKESDEALFSIKLKLKKNSYTSDLLSIEDSGLSSEAYFSESDAVHVGIEYRAGETMEEEISLYQNVPNPWTENTTIKFYMPQVQDYSIQLYDVNGKLIYRLNNTSKKGINEVVIENDQFETGGVLYYELISTDVRLINKMLLLR